jgi:hypothetical protein
VRGGSEDVVGRCVTDMEQGLLHVDTVTWGGGMTLAFYFVNGWKPCDQELWDRYWALSPSVPLFWKIAESLHFDEVFMSCRKLRKTTALWEDLGLLLGYAHMMPAWMRKKVFRRFRNSVRFEWMAAVVVQCCMKKTFLENTTRHFCLLFVP